MLTTLALLLLVSTAQSGSMAAGVIRGTVVDAASGVPLPGVVVTLRGTDREVVTAPDGTFRLDGVTPGRQMLVVSLVGYVLARPSVDVPPGAVAEIVVPLAGGTGTYQETVNVVSDPIRGSASSVPAAMVLNSAELLELRGVLTDDPLRAVQSLPSAATGDDFRAEFSVRGSDFAHVGLMVDGIPVAWPVHTVRDRESEGSLSLINGSVLDSATLLAGTYPQDRPGKTGAWLDLVIREGSRAARRVQGAVSASSASIVVEGPLGSGRRGSWLVSARQSYLQWLLDRLDDEGETAFGFTDIQSKLVFDVTNRQQLQVTIVGGRAALDDEHDNPDQSSVDEAHARTGLISVGWRAMLAPSLVATQRLAIAANEFRTDATLGAVLAEGSASNVAYRGGIDWTTGRDTTLQLGAFARREQTDEAYVRFGQVRGPQAAAVEERVGGTAWHGAAHARAIWSGTRLSLDAGLMAQPSTFATGASWAPWLLVRVPLRGRLVLRGGVDLRRQLPEIDHALGTFRGAGIREERARQIEVALEQRFASAWRWQLTAYDRREDDVLRLEGSEPYLSGGRIVRASPVPFWANALEGWSRGVEATLQRRAPTGVSGWIGYSYGRSRYTDHLRNETYWGDYDQRHAVNAYAQYRLTPKTSVSVKARAGSNFPIPGYFESRDGALWLGPQRNAARLPRYARVDLRANHTFTFDRRRLTLFAEILNVLGRENFASDSPRVAPSGRVSSATHSLFPFLPSAGLMVEF